LLQGETGEEALD